jgi:hypothetical protein
MKHKIFYRLSSIRVKYSAKNKYDVYSKTMFCTFAVTYIFLPEVGNSVVHRICAFTIQASNLRDRQSEYGSLEQAALK